MDMKRGKREKFLKKTEERMEKELTSRDVFLGRSNRAIEELTDVLNVLGERLEDMFRLYTPKLEVADREKYAKLISIVEKDRTDGKELSKLFGSGKANSVAKDLEGVRKMKDADLALCKQISDKIIELYRLKENLEKEEEKLCSEICPNLAYVGGAHLAAKMIAHVGSLQRLALLPASTIQVIGAEKALFKHLKNKNVRPPKHGLIFQHHKISQAPRKIRGKIARTLAAKLTSAAKADAFTKNFIAEKLKKQFEERYIKVIEEYKNSKKKR